MAKRFTASDKWEDNWFRKLPLKSKLFWIFILDRCDVAGIWKIDYEFASFCIGEEVNSSILEDFNERIEELNGDKLWITKFIEFQYGYLSKDAAPHKGVIFTLKKYGLFERVIKGLQKGSITLKDKTRLYKTIQDKDKKRFDPKVTDLIHKTAQKMKGIK